MIEKMGLDAYRAQESKKRAERRARKKQAEQKKKAEGEEEANITPKDANTANVLRIHKAMTGEDFTNYNLFLKVPDVIEFMKRYKESTRKTYYVSIASKIKNEEGFKAAYNAYTHEYLKLAKKLSAITGDNKLSPEEKQNWVSWEVLTKAYKAIRDPRSRALITLYTLIEPRRRGLAVSLIAEQSGKKLSGDNNYMIFNKNGKPSKIILNHYKTSKTYGQYIIPLTGKKLRPLREAFTEHISKNNISLGSYIFGTLKGEIMTPSNMSTEFKNAFMAAIGKEITFNLIRHIRISEFLNINRSINEKKQLAEAMGHSLEVQATYNRIIKE